MKNILYRSLVSLVLLAVSAPAMAQGKPQVINVPLSRAGEPMQLDISILSARIEVIGEDRDDVMFEIAVMGGERKIITPSGTKAISGGAYSYEVEEDDNEVSLDADWRTDKVNVVARIPRRADVRLRTVNDGELTVRNVTGNLELHNVNGPITASGISGSVIAESVNQTIDVGFTSIDDVNASAFESINGDIVVRLPGNAGAEVHLDSAMGEILSDFEVDVMPSQGVVKREEGARGVSVKIENVIVAKINGGGPVLRLKSLNGDINIKKAAQ